MTSWTGTPVSEAVIAEGLGVRPPGRLQYELVDVERMLGYLFHGGEQWTREDAPDADMPKSKGNPAQQGTHMAAMVDMRRAVEALVRGGQLRNPEALWLYYAEGFTQNEIAHQQGVTRQSVQEALDVDVMAVRDAMLEGLRPGVRGGRWPQASSR